MNKFRAVARAPAKTERGSAHIMILLIPTRHVNTQIYIYYYMHSAL
jgi:hypothetical protein